MPRFLVCAVLPQVPRFITVLPLPLSLIQNAGAAGLKDLPFFLDRFCRFTDLLKRKKKQSCHVEASTCAPSLRTCHLHHSSWLLRAVLPASLSGAAGSRQVQLKQREAMHVGELATGLNAIANPRSGPRLMCSSSQRRQEESA